MKDTLAFICQEKRRQFRIMPKKLITDDEVERYRRLMEAVERSSPSVKSAAARLGIGSDQFSNFRETRDPGLAQLWLAVKNLNIPLDYFSTDYARITPDMLKKRVFEVDDGTKAPHVHGELGNMLKNNPAVERYLMSADGEDAPLGVRITLASINWSTLGTRGEPTHDQIHRIRVTLQETVKETL